MKKYISIAIIGVCLLFPSYAMCDDQFTLQEFLQYLDEDSLTIRNIMQSSYGEQPRETIETYLGLNMRLEIDSNAHKLDWQYGWVDSTFVCKCAEYLSTRITRDTLLYLIDPCLLQAYILNIKYNQPLLLSCAEYTIQHFHSRQALVIPDLYYENHKEMVDRMQKLQYNEMAKCVLLYPKHLYCFSNQESSIFDEIIHAPVDTTSYFAQFRSLLDGYSDMELARLSIEQENTLAQIIQQGVANGEEKSIMLYAFMLYTGQFVERDVAKGQYLLNTLFLTQRH